MQGVKKAMTRNKATPLMIQGTHSDAGKSIVVTALSRIFKQDGYKTAPFKSQNMALNSYITVDGKEIGRAQGVQAEASEIVATTDMNPILIKPTHDYEAQIVVHGRPLSNMMAKAYRTDFYQQGKKIIREAYWRLAEEYDRIVIEGAGSPAEVNLNDRELVNMSVARMADAPVVLVGDIDKGGVFASLVGTLALLEEEDRNRVIGIVINKFRGDLSLLQPGLDWFENYTGKPILGVIPYLDDLLIDAEDSLSLVNYSQSKNKEKDLDIAVIQYPKISNFTDADPLCAELDCHVRFVKNRHELGTPDLVILPGSKNTIDDFLYLNQKGLDKEIVAAYNAGSSVFGICGGYQMLGEKIRDPHQVESHHHEVNGLNLLPIQTTLAKTKTTIRSVGEAVWGGKAFPVEGYEIHMGETTSSISISPFIYLQHQSDGSKNETETLSGTYFHGIFHNDDFRAALLNQLRSRKGLIPLHNRSSFSERKKQEFDRLANHVRESLDFPRLNQLMQEFKQREQNFHE